MSLDEAQKDVLARIAERIVEDEPEALERAARAAEEARKEALKAHLHLLLDRGIPLDAAEFIVGVVHVGADLVEQERIDDRPALRYAKEFMAGAPGTLVISGGVGTGKTIAASWAAAQKPREPYIGTHADGRGGIWPAEYHARFRDVGELTLLPRWGSEVAATMLMLKRCSILAIDDVGNESDHEQFASVLDALIVSRHDNHLRTVLTTNMPAGDFVKTYGKRVEDRIRGSKDGGGFLSIGEGASMR